MYIVQFNLFRRPSVKPQKYDNPVNFANYDDDDKAL